MNTDSSSPTSHDSEGAAQNVAGPEAVPSPPAAVVQQETVGFGNSPRRIALELGVVALVIVGVGVGAIWGGGALAAALTPFVSPEIDRQLGAAADKQMSLLGGECPNPEAKAYVEKIAAPILAAAGELPFEFQFRVANDPQVNAFALPGGFVTVNRGLLEAAESGEEVAGVLGHELQHALLRHGTRRILRQTGSRALLWLATGGTDYDWMAQGVGTLTGLSYDRGQESEADLEGLRLLTKAGIDPNGLASFFARLEKDSVTPPALLSTHPDPGDRAEAVRLASAGAQVTQKLPSPKGIKCE